MYYRALPLLLFFAIVVIILYSVSHHVSFDKDPLVITAEEARRRRHTLILDVRSPKEREESGFLPLSISIDPSRVVEEVPFLLGQKPGSLSSPTRTPILVYSNTSDNRAKHIAERLYNIGFIGVRYLKGSYFNMLPPGPLTSVNGKEMGGIES
jgi:rhodanese-related sulfurtransferase